MNLRMEHNTWADIARPILVDAGLTFDHNRWLTTDTRGDSSSAPGIDTISSANGEQSRR